MAADTGAEETSPTATAGVATQRHVADDGTLDPVARQHLAGEPGRSGTGRGLRRASRG